MSAVKYKPHLPRVLILNLSVLFQDNFSRRDEKVKPAPQIRQTSVVVAASSACPAVCLCVCAASHDLPLATSQTSLQTTQGNSIWQGLVGSSRWKINSQITLARDDGLFDAGYPPLHSPHPLATMLKGGSKKTMQRTQQRKRKSENAKFPLALSLTLCQIVKCVA